MQPTTSDQALGGLQSAEQAVQNPNDILQAQNKALGVDSAQSTVSGLRGAIDNTTKLLSQVAPSVMGRTANSLVTNAQANRQIQNEQAPISQNLTQEGTQYNNANSDLAKLESEAQTAASGIYQGEQDKVTQAQNLYNALFGKEQAAQAQANTQADLAERQREANMSASSSASSGLGGVLSTLLGGGSSSGGGYGSQQRADKGFNFQDPNGNPTNAVNYSRANNVPIRTQLQRMANAGDAGAKTALDYVGNDYGINVPKLKSLLPSPQKYNQTLSILKSLGFSIQ